MALAFDPLSYFEQDNDSLHVLPLALVPLSTKTLQSATLKKNGQLRSVVELFSHEGGGSGQIAVNDLPKQFDWPEGRSHPDMCLLDRLSSLSSYDVYSLRITLRSAGIPLQQNAVLELSEAKRDQLAQYMRAFTQPLLREVFSSDSANASMEEDDLISVEEPEEDQDLDEGLREISQIFSNPDPQRTLRRLHRLAAKLELDLDEVPLFLEDYGDIYLSVAYYKDCLQRVKGALVEFQDALPFIRTAWIYKDDRDLLSHCDSTAACFSEATSYVTHRLEAFDRQSEGVWRNISAQRFREFEALVKSEHASLGAILCGVSVKLEHWKSKFPAAELASPPKMATFLRSEIRPGMDAIRERVPEGWEEEVLGGTSGKKAKKTQKTRAARFRERLQRR